MLALTAADSAELRVIAGEIHDWYFDVDDVSFDADGGEVVVPFRRWSYDQARVVESGPRRRRPLGRILNGLRWVESEAPWYRWFLRIGDATSCAIADDAQIGIADFNDLEYDAANGILVVDCCIPVRISVGVRRLTVSLRETDEVLGMARYRRGMMNGEVHPSPSSAARRI